MGDQKRMPLASFRNDFQKEGVVFKSIFGIEKPLVYYFNGVFEMD